MELFEKTLSEDRVYQGKIISLRRDQVELENGRTVLREVVEHPGGVAILAIDELDRVLFVRQFRYAFKKVLLELPAGKLEYGEDPRSCGIRELEEEAGLQADQFEPLASLVLTPAYLTERIHIYLAHGLHATRQRLDEDEFLTVEWIPLDQALKMALSGEIEDAKTLVGLLKYRALRELQTQ